MTTIKNGAATSLAYQGGTSGPGGESNGQPTLSWPLSCDDAHYRADGKTTGKDNQLRDELTLSCMPIYYGVYGIDRLFISRFWRHRTYFSVDHLSCRNYGN